MMLGDNSTASRDGRGWQRTDQIPPGGSDSEGWDRSGRETWEVPEALLIGKAFCVYWPHMKPIWPAISFSKERPAARDSQFLGNAAGFVELPYEVGLTIWVFSYLVTLTSIHTSNSSHRLGSRGILTHWLDGLE